MRALRLLLVAALLVPAPASRGREPTDPSRSMDRILEALRLLLPPSLDDASFSAASRREELLGALDVLVEAAEEVERHSRERDVAFGFLSRSLGADVREMRQRYARGRYGEARYFLHQLTETCVACHSRLPSNGKPALSEALLARTDLEALEPGKRARLQAATRRFEAALGTYEAIFADPGVAPAAMDLSGHFVDYLSLCIRVRHDLRRPLPVLEAFARRDDVPHYLRRNAFVWIESLKELSGALDGPATLERAGELLRRAERRSALPGDRRALVHYLVASSLLHRFVAEGEPARDQQSRAFYMLGVIGARTQRSYWVPETEFYLETSIRLAPGAPHAEDAYAVLEEFTILGYTGSSGVNLPPEVQAMLDELRALIDAS